MTHIIDNNQIEGLSDSNRFRMGTVVQASAASTFTFSTSTTGAVIFTGTTAGQIVSLGNSTTYPVGQELWVYNETTQNISIRNSSGTILYTLPSEQSVKCVLQVNSTSAGTWVLRSTNRAALSAGSTPFAFFADTTNNVNNKFLSTQNIASSDLQSCVVPTSSSIRNVTFCSSNTASTCTLEFRLNTTVGTPALSVAISTGALNTQVVPVTLNVTAGDQLNCKVATGAANVGKPIVLVYI